MSRLTFQSITEDFSKAAISRNDIRSVAIFGSRARDIQPADKWSDLDLIVFVEKPDVFVHNQDWLSSIGEVLIAFNEMNVFGSGIEIRILFDGGLDVDFLFFPSGDMVQILSRNDVSSWVRAGSKILVDKDARLADLLRISSYQTPSGELSGRYGDFKNLVGDFFFHVVWTTKKLLRGEILTAKNCCDIYMKDLLLRMIVWNTRARDKNIDLTFYRNGRYFEKWADISIVRDFQSIYAHYDEEDIKNALKATFGLFSRMAKETGELLGYEYPVHYEEQATALFKSYLEVVSE